MVPTRSVRRHPPLLSLLWVVFIHVDQRCHHNRPPLPRERGLRRVRCQLRGHPSCRLWLALTRWQCPLQPASHPWRNRHNCPSSHGWTVPCLAWPHRRTCTCRRPRAPRRLPLVALARAMARLQPRTAVLDPGLPHTLLWLRAVVYGEGWRPYHAVFPGWKHARTHATRSAVEYLCLAGGRCFQVTCVVWCLQRRRRRPSHQRVVLSRCRDIGWMAQWVDNLVTRP